MSVKIFDTMTTATPNFPLAYAEKINVKLQDGTEDNLQNLFDNKELGGGGDSSVTLTQQEYEALSEEQKLGGLYYTYDTKRIYKNGVQYGASDAEGIGYNNAESGIQATTVQGAIDKVVKTVEDTYAKTTDIPTTLPANGGNANTVNNHTVKSDVPENAKFTDTIYDDTEVKAKLGGLSDSINSFKNFQIVSSLGSVKLKEIIQSEFPKIKNDRGMIKISDGTTLYCGTYIKYSNTQGSATFTNVEGTSYIWTILGDTVTLQEIATMDKVESKYSEENVLTSTDWNTLNTRARYYFSGGTPMTNSPEEVPFGLLEVINVGSYCRIQRYFAFNGKLYIRRWSGNSWNEWYRFDGISI